MDRVAATIATMALLLSADSSGLVRNTRATSLESPPAAETSPAGQGPAQTDNQAQPARKTSQGDSNPLASAKAAPLQEESRLNLVRFVDGENVRVVSPIPAGKKGFHLKAGSPLDEKALRMALATAGSSINPGDRAQITSLDFKEKEIIVGINGGGKGKTRLRDRIHLEVGGMPTMTTTTTTNAPAAAASTGATLYLDFDKQVPDMTPEVLERYLSGLLDFSKKHSAAIQWVESLPPEIQKAIQDKQPVVGMDHEMVLAAMGRPDRKVREKGADGSEIEDWIYGTPPEKTIFVSFEGDKVTQVHQYPQ